MTNREALAGLLILLGLGSATYAGFLVSKAAGFAVLGALCLLLGLSLASTAEAVVELDEGDV